ncbi:DUF308 domain-containing protein [Saccharomonospora sp. NPDC046836]|uniref:HdeD family acid-resistance protein n=1 Tax=Saccharomonospora sp. NPDC046836 TaxID=3156921 RepID=UPI0033E0A738
MARAATHGEAMGETAGRFARSSSGLIGIGAVTIIIGALIIAWPGATAAAVAVLFGLFLLIAGAYRIVWAMAADEVSGGLRAVMALLGALGILVGLLCLRAPFHAVAVLVLLAGLFWIVGGVLELVHAIGSPGMFGRGWAVGAGAFSLIAGIVVLAFPAVSLTVLIWFVGLELIVYGILLLVRGFQLRRAA